MSASLKLHSKRILKDGTIVEMKVWEVPRSHNYPEGFKYSLIAVDPTSETKVLMDNHNPKGHHYHLDREEIPLHLHQHQYLMYLSPIHL